MELTLDQRRVKSLLTETITLLCKNGLHFKSEFSIEGLLGITLDKQDVFLVSIKETFQSGEQGSLNENCEENSSNIDDKKIGDAYASHSNFPSRKRSRVAEAAGQGVPAEGRPSASSSIQQNSSQRGSVGNVLCDSPVVPTGHGKSTPPPKSEWKKHRQNQGTHNNTQRYTEISKSTQQSSNLSEQRNSQTRQSFSNENKVIIDEMEFKTDTQQLDEVAECDQNSQRNETLEGSSELLDSCQSQLSGGNSGLRRERETANKHREVTIIDDTDFIQIKEENIESAIEDVADDQDYSAFLNSCGKSESSLLQQNFTFTPVSHMTSNDFGHSSGMSYADAGGGGAINWSMDMSEFNRNGQNSYDSQGRRVEGSGMADLPSKRSAESDRDRLISSKQLLSTGPEDRGQASLSFTSSRGFTSSRRFNFSRGFLSNRGLKSNYGPSANVGRSANPRSISSRALEADPRTISDQRYCCPYCPRRFSASNNLRGHLAVHTGVKEFKCVQCGQEFAYKHRLKTHVERCMAQPLPH